MVNAANTSPSYNRSRRGGRTGDVNRYRLGQNKPRKSWQVTKMRNRLDLRTLFQSLEDPALPDGFTSRIMRQVGATNRPVEAAGQAPQLLAPPMTRWAQASIGTIAAVAMLLLGGVTLLFPSTWLTMLNTLEATLFTAVWVLTWTAGVLAESLPFLSGAVRVGEALDLILRTPQVTAVVAAASLFSLIAVHLLHRFSARRGGRRRARGTRAGALLLVGGLCFTGLASGQPQDAGEGQEAQEEASSTLEDARERLDEALEEVGEEARGAIEETIERLDDLERDLNGIDVVVDLDNRVAFGSTVRVGRGEVVNDIVSVGGDVKVDGEVRGDAVSIGGEAKINGRVTGEVVSIGGDIELGPEAEVFGDIVTVGGQLVREEGSSVLGEVSEVDWGEFNWNLSGDWFDGWDGDWFPGVGDRPPFFRLGKVFEFVQSIIFTLLLIALSGLVLLVAPKGVGRVKAAAASDLWVMFAVGLGVEVFFLPVLIIVSLLLTVTVIGIPFAILLWPVALIGLTAAFVFGYAGSASAAGDWCRRRFQGAGRVAAGSFAALALGVLVIQALALVADLLGFLGLPWFFRAMFRLPGILICYLAWTIGLGAVFMTRFGRSDYGAAVSLPPVPPTTDGDDVAIGDPGPSAPGDDGDASAAIPKPPAG